ncbi:cell wall hydrolase [Microvirga massiliensis]|uniref:cell wall hydrolase n=1 Tax=Microvirga massiliensis TaxID=1033741 RepID=UPI000660E2C7|nr:cell wall hydrolase [Microvirga massiliensis]
MRLHRRRLQTRWICATAVPWVLAGGLLVSFTAAAGNDPRAGVSAALRTTTGELLSHTLLVPLFGTARDEGAGTEPEELPLRSAAKKVPMPAPEVVRSLKGDPVVDLGPSLSRRARSVAARAASRMVFTNNDRILPPTILMPGRLEGPNLEEQGFEPWEGSEWTTTRQTSSVQSPAAAAAGSTGAAVGARTPAVKRAVVISSATPAPTDAVPAEIAAAPVSFPQSLRLDRERAGGLDGGASDPERPRYADLVDPDNLQKERRCLAEAIYFEARSEPEEGQAAVAQVVLNRVRSGLYPSSICGVVYQNRHRHLACQFTFACEGKALRISEPESWNAAQRIAGEVLNGKRYLAEVGGSTHYHANYVRPYWARRLKKMDVIGRHIFYKLRPGQT